ncbi:hypothetical protein Bbelb_354710 [Branchiostoma belcheri]|nr:hypothetical protein Bbelb_354710 [Branchiostoma belcheri]
MGDYCQGNETEEHISIKETEALTKVLMAMEEHEILVANIVGQGVQGSQGGTSRAVTQGDVENTSDKVGPMGVSAPPVAYTSPIVKEYLKAVTGEQLQQGITPQQAKPVFLPKIIKVCQYIVQQIEREKFPIKLFIRARDQAIFKAVFFAGDRGLVKKM